MTGNRILSLMELCSGPLWPFLWGSPWQKKSQSCWLAICCFLTIICWLYTHSEIFWSLLVAYVGQMPALGGKKKSLGGKHIKAVNNVVLTSVKKLLPWQCAVLERHGCWEQARVALGRLMQCVWNEGDIPLHTKANVYNTVVITLLYAWKDGTIYSCHGKWSSQFMQCLWVLAGTEGHDEISEYCQILLCSSVNLCTCQLTESSKPSLMAHSDRVKGWKTLKKRYQSLLKADY